LICCCRVLFARVTTLFLKALKSNAKCESYEPLKWQDSPFDHFGVLKKNVISIQPLQKVTK
jgi:hypothetical protein